jgi:3-oxoacyl-[acyl-carrier protein] reductase
MTTKAPVAWITGGGTGVGRATAIALAQLGFRIAINYSRSQQEAVDTGAEIERMGQTALVAQADVALDADCVRMTQAILNRFGRVDVLVNCAGTTDFIPFPDLDAVTDEHWIKLYQVNVMGAFHCARAVRNAMMQVGCGQIINVSSVAAQLAQGSSIPYCCSKAALDNLTVSLARTLAPHIRVNGIAPGFIDGRWTQNGLGDKFDAIKNAYVRSLPLGKVCEPADIADAIVSLITGSKLITGQTLTVDAGMTISGFSVKFD